MAVSEVHTAAHERAGVQREWLGVPIGAVAGALLVDAAIFFMTGGLGLGPVILGSLLGGAAGGGIGGRVAHGSAERRLRSVGGKSKK